MTNDQQNEIKNEIINKILETRVLNNSIHNDTIKMIKDFSNLFNLTGDYDNFNFNDMQNILSKNSDKNDNLNEEDKKNKREWEENLTELEAAEIITFEINDSEDEVI